MITRFPFSYLGGEVELSDGARQFVRLYDDLRGGKHVVVVVVTEAVPAGRHWIVTAYLARKLAKGEIEWKRS